MSSASSPAPERIQRLASALGNGPHSASLDTAHHLRTILVTLRDEDALRILTPPAELAAVLEQTGKAAA